VKIRTLIIDDEPHAREGIRIRLKKYPEIDIAGECSSGLQAVATINNLKPDLVFLDIQMPEMNGFEVLRKLDVRPLPIVVFVTAYDTYAVKAFEVHALDYVLKPINDRRFNDTLRSVLSEFNHRNLEKYARALQKVAHEALESDGNPVRENRQAAANDSSPYLHRLMVKSKEQIFVISAADIEWLESAGDYVYVHASAQKHLVRETMTSLEQRLDPARFIRIHRSALVNLQKVKSLRPTEHGDYDLFLSSGVKLKLSRTYWEHFQKVFGNPV